jgi:hypothetical protein
MADTYEITEDTTRKSYYDQIGNQSTTSTDVSRQNGVKSSSQVGEQKEFVNVGCKIAFSVKIRGGFPSLPSNC